MKKVSVVVPAYCPGKGINRVVRSLDAQTMSTDDFELIIIDDGSPDNTWSQLEAIRDERGYVRIDRIENSGWPSRPRNIGTDMAEGEYVLYMDHDDELFPDGLRAAYDYASRHSADVLSAKESKTSDISWGISNFTTDVPNAKPIRGISSLLPMMPHKFYRTAFLREHDIRFPEGRRMLWEDIYFNVAAYRHADVISILSSVPVYLWVATNANNSATYSPRDEEFWQKLSALLTYIHETLPGEEFAADRDATLAHQLNTRVVGRFYTAYTKSTDRSWVSMAQPYLDHILSDLAPAHLDRRLPVVVKPRAHLMRQGRLDLLEQLAAAEDTWVGQSRADAVSWDESGRLVLSSTARWTNKAKQPLTLRQSGDRLLRSLPAELAEALPAELIDVTAGVKKGRSMITFRHRQSNTTWELPGESRVVVEPVAATPEDSQNGTTDEVNAARETSETEVTVQVTSTVRIDVGADRQASVWDVHARNALIGYSNHRAVLTDAVPPRAVVDGRVVQCLRDKAGKLSVDIAAGHAALAGMLVPAADRVRVEPGPGGESLLTVVTDVPMHGIGVEGRLVLTPLQPFVRRAALSTTVSKVGVLRALQQRLVVTLPAQITSESGRAQVSATIRAIPGSYGVALSTGGPHAVWPVRVQVGGAGRVRVEPLR